MADRPQFRIPETIKEDTKKYEQEVERFLNGNLDPVRFKGYRVPMGVYGQRGQTEGAEKYMIRVRAPGGVITKEQLEVLNDLSREYGAEYLHFTTRQDIQIHQVNMEDTPQILYKLLEVGLSPRGGGGNTVRNIMNSPRAGVNPQEKFDTTPYSLALTEYLIRTRSSFNLPRKYKIAFSSTAQDKGLATINDLGFIAKEKDGRQGFKVYAAGGMGNDPEIALLLEEFIAADKVFHVAEAIKRFFDDYGDRSNKHQARLRFVRKRLGDEEFVAKYKKYLKEVLEEGIDTEEIYYYQEPRSGAKDRKQNLEVDYIYPEAKPGYYSVELRPPEGDITYQELEELLSLLSSEQISLRTTNKQGLLIRGVKAENLDDLIAEIKGVNEQLLVPNVATMPIACKGASTCRLGLCLSPNLAEAVRDQLSQLDKKLQSLLPQIYISGCPNCCGQHLIGKIGFEGKAKRFDDRLVPHYSLLVGGNVAEDESRYGEKVIDLPAKRIPDFLVELAQQLSEKADYTGDFNAYLAQGGREEVVKVAKQFTEIPSYEQNSNIYQDWGSNEDFSLAGRGPGECGTGVMDIIELDIDTANDNYQTGRQENDDEELYQAIVNAARALLIVRGIDTEKDRVILSSFKSEFIDKDLVDKSKADLLDAAFDYKLGDIDSLVDYQQEIKELIQRVEELFNSLNSKLEFDLDELDQQNEDNDKAGSQNDAETKLADLRGVKCPMNFVKAKVAISPLEAGEVLEIYLDPGEPIQNVPQSLAEEGHEILEQEQTEEGYYILTVKKGK
ncbi:sulfurtransferase TusA family protein [Sporohalobacter salinus]|uniref:sulfurtransferase TusA family protein n=1 Tax=Sporohalobacter salinus TaxID=1494606 RepID=UPI00195FBE31|nr:sulfurtransferase TusA family protein [Sporohalobacter salinus]MBM7624694.1 sulfite reductase (ferredoxin) [Sporohalobacter salinus]